MPVVDLNPAPNPPRWRVVLVRLPAGGADALAVVLPRDRPVTVEDLPLVTRITPDLETARATAERLRAAGAVVALLEDPGHPDLDAFCPDHPTALAPIPCARCGRRVCVACRLSAEGQSLCPPCFALRREAARRVRTRQLFVFFLFAVFLYQVHDWLMEDRQRVSPMGPVRVGLFQLVPADGLRSPIVRALNGEPVSGYTGPALADLPAWYDGEHRRYTGGTGPYLQLVRRGPWAVDLDPPPLAGPDDPFWTSAWRSWSYIRYFRGLVLDRGVDPADYAVRLYVVYAHGADDLASHSRGSEKGRVGIAWVDLDEQNPVYALVTIAHELAHTLGAADAYNPETGLAMTPEGFVQPHADPLYPQRYAEVMAVDIPVAPGAEGEVHSLDRVRIGYQTAADMGWIGEEQARWFYQSADNGPEDALEQAAPAVAPPAPEEGPPPGI